MNKIKEMESKLVFIHETHLLEKDTNGREGRAVHCIILIPGQSDEPHS